MTAAGRLDRRRLAADLRAAVAGEVRFDTAARALYASDASNYRQPPIGVVVPRTVDDVVAVHEVCRAHGAPLLPRGCGTSLSGEAVNAAVVIDCSKELRGIGEVDVERRLVTAEPGAVNAHVNRRARRHGLVFGPDPSTRAYCTIGGNVGNNSCGVHSVQAALYGEGGRTSDNVRALEVLTYDGLRLRVGRTSEEELDRIVREGGRRGEIYAALRDLRDRYADLVRERFPRIPRRVSGYNLDELLPEHGFDVARALVGTEGTCVTVLEATLQLVPDPPARTLLVAGYEDVARCGDHVATVMRHGPIGCEAFDRVLFRDAPVPDGLSLPRGDAWLLVELGGDSQAAAEERARALLEELRALPDAPVGIALVDDPRQARTLWAAREAGLAATSFPPGTGHDHWPGWEDSAVPPEAVGDYVRDLLRLYERHGYQGAVYGHFGQGCVHSRIDFDLRTPAGIAAFRRFMEEAADLVVSHGGSLSGEHGDGQARAELLPRMFGDELVQAFREFKAIWDPDARMNPGKVVDPQRIDEQLRLEGGLGPRPQVHFSYPEDGGDFAHAAIRCVGFGRCRTPEGVDVMCPSYVATREEQHSTRGRAHLLFEMLRGEIVTDGWRSREVLEALDLCLACKGCTHDCPVSVDMPTYKAEFLSHHYAGRLRPRQAYAFGLVDRVARLASHAPGLANALTHAPGLARLAKLAAGMAPEREVPSFAPLTLRGWLARRAPRNPGGPRVLLWPDTFTDHFRTDVGVAAVEALEQAGYDVVVPRARLCCGRPLYDYGMLDRARASLLRVLDHLRDDVRAGVPLVGIEPSCLAVFKDELPRLVPGDDAARLARQSFHFAEFLGREGIEPPALRGRALVWGHCHQKATGGIEPEHALLERMGLEIEPLAGGCCGLAGSFGFEADHYELSIACGEQELLPRVRKAPAEAFVVAGGFSCATQIEQAGTGRRALHVAQLMQLARAYGPDGPPGGPPERFAAGRPRRR